ncbi:MAG: TonB-dependent receptor plug domain-containing protein, partial [Bacteroidia bacterium]
MFVSTFSWGQTFIKVLDAVNKNALACKVLFVNGEGQADSSISEDGFFSLPIENPQKVQIVPLIPIESTELYVQPSKKYVIELKDPLGIITKLGEVVVTDIHSNKTFDNTVLNVSKITAKRIEELGAIDLKDALSFENNIRFSRDNAIGSSGLSMMGIGGENVKVLIDGVPVIGRLFNNVDLEQFNLENVKQIEVVKGPMSVIYGSNALAGTINIVTSNKSKKPRANLNGNYETDGQYNLTGTFSKSVKNHYFTLSGGRTMFTGWSAENIDRTFDWIPKEQYTGRFQYTYKHKDASINVRSEMIRSKLIDRGTPLAPYRESAIDQYYNNQRFDNSLSYHNKIGESSIQIIASNNYFNRVKNKYLKNLVTLEKSIIPRAAEQDTQTFNASVLRAIYGFDRKKT